MINLILQNVNMTNVVCRLKAYLPVFLLSQTEQNSGRWTFARSFST